MNNISGGAVLLIVILIVIFLFLVWLWWNYFYNNGENGGDFFSGFTKNNNKSIVMDMADDGSLRTDDLTIPEEFNMNKIDSKDIPYNNLLGILSEKFNATQNKSSPLQGSTIIGEEMSNIKPNNLNNHIGNNMMDARNNHLNNQVKNKNNVAPQHYKKEKNNSTTSSSSETFQPCSSDQKTYHDSSSMFEDNTFQPPSADFPFSTDIEEYIGVKNEKPRYNHTSSSSSPSSSSSSSSPSSSSPSSSSPSSSSSHDPETCHMCNNKKIRRRPQRKISSDFTSR